MAMRLSARLNIPALLLAGHVFVAGAEACAGGSDATGYLNWIAAVAMTGIDGTGMGLVVILWADDRIVSVGPSVESFGGVAVVIGMIGVVVMSVAGRALVVI